MTEPSRGSRYYRLRDNPEGQPCSIFFRDGGLEVVTGFRVSDDQSPSWDKIIEECDPGADGSFLCADGMILFWDGKEIISKDFDMNSFTHPEMQRTDPGISRLILGPWDIDLPVFDANTEPIIDHEDGTCYIRVPEADVHPSGLRQCHERRFMTHQLQWHFAGARVWGSRHVKFSDPENTYSQNDGLVTFRFDLVGDPVNDLLRKVQKAISEVNLLNEVDITTRDGRVHVHAHDYREFMKTDQNGKVYLTEKGHDLWGAMMGLSEWGSFPLSQTPCVTVHHFDHYSYGYTL